ncbi:hypothetical protein TRFO_37432 [Tritrichomonas foetus]|uniref:Uncharacterized protein n=1 Tax=Tritrichomonas foetus TaxID=1144522 RepID=A0A1J4JCM0_9EUKA|nr:hypothetical protein TRFO_37432 [Tritrichomonas foetus]|eukprot:OHS96417.1 hypothetical protein TRFO_37432 [Tritrichomonas foetus]
MTSITKKNIGNKFKNFVAKTQIKSHVSKSTSDPTMEMSDEVPEKFVFVPADTSLDMPLQARENLANFRTFLESSPESPNLSYDVVYQTMSHAFSDLTNKTADLQTTLGKSKASAAELDEKLRQGENESSILEKKVRELNGEVRNLKVNYHNLKERREKLESFLNRTNDYKKVLHSLCLQREEILSQALRGNSKAEDTHRETERLQAELEKWKREAEENEQKLACEVTESESRVRSLTNKAKLIEAREKQPKKAPASPQQDEESKRGATYVIEDNVRISQAEIKQLRTMIQAIKKENAELNEERESKMMDIDCISQENLGLKQLIRQMTEGK